MNKEYRCEECKNKIWNEVLKEWECKFANIPNREECVTDFEEEKPCKTPLK